jgi:transcriptional regulator with XRE-family HTH domain
MDLFLLGQTLRESRLQQRLSQAEVASAAGLHPVTVSELERGRAPDIGVRKLSALLNALGLELVVRPLGHPRTLDDIARELVQTSRPTPIRARRVRPTRVRTGR